MCGIVGYVGSDNTKDVIIKGLIDLEYRGYDSSGVSFIKNNKLITKKELGSVSNLEKALKNIDFSNIAIAHTRWATHGAPSKKNAHPHTSGNWAIVHNGIIENANMLKSTLHNHTFKSDTDTEVIVALLDYVSTFEKNNMRALIKTCELLQGSFALACINAHNSNEIYVARNQSPLYIAFNDSGAFITSDLSLLENKTSTYYTLDNFEFANVTPNNVIFYNKEGKTIKKHAKNLILSNISSDLKNFEHFMLKEMYDIPLSLTNTFEALNQLNFLEDVDLKNINEVHLFGCGTAYHTAKMGALILESLVNIPAYAHIASEYNDMTHPIKNDALYVFISQSGETSDTLNAMHTIQKHTKAIVITNVHHSTMALESDYLIPIEAGKEISVASTKAYNTLNLAVLMLVQKIANTKNLSLAKLNLPELTKAIKDILADKTKIESLADITLKYSKIFFIGRKYDYVTALEGSLKLKEITYINSSAFPAGELKHGTLALVDKKTLIILVATDEQIKPKIESALNEVKARGAKTLVITNLIIKQELCDYIFRLPKLDIISTQLVNSLPLQLLAYYASIKKGINPDKPKNLAKSVTVE